MLADFYTHDPPDPTAQDGTASSVWSHCLDGTSLLLGAAMTVTGTWSWLRSKRAARAFESER